MTGFIFSAQRWRLIRKVLRFCSESCSRQWLLNQSIHTLMCTPDIVSLEEINNINAVDIRWFLPFIVHRLQPFASDRSVTLEVTLQNIGSIQKENRKLTLTWNKEVKKLRCLLCKTISL